MSEKFVTYGKEFSDPDANLCSNVFSKAVEELKPYLDHKRDCRSLCHDGSPSDKPCSCGLDELRKENYGGRSK